MAAFRCTKRPWNACSLAAIIAAGVCLGLLAVCFNFRQTAAAGNTAQFFNRAGSFSADETTGTRPPLDMRPAVAPHPKWASFGGEHKSENARQLADWVADSRDNRSMPFAIVDKVDAKVFVFDASGRLLGAAPVLLGLAVGDFAVQGIGDRKLADIRPEERTTPAGRFVAYLGFNAKKTDVLWVDYKNAVSLHRVITNNPGEHRLERLAAPGPRDKRISYGCINVPAKFFDNVVKPAFTGTYGIVYVLPETRSIGDIFKSFYNVESRWGNRTAANVQERPRAFGCFVQAPKNTDNPLPAPFCGRILSRGAITGHLLS